MTATAKPLIDALLVLAATTTQYTSPGGGKGTILDKVSGTNTTGAAATITVYLVKSGGAAGAANTITSAQSISAGQAYTFPELVGHLLGPGDFIATASGTNNAITLRASGRELS